MMKLLQLKRPLWLVAREDYEAETVRQVKIDSGDWSQRKLMGVQRGRGLWRTDRD